MIAVEQVSKRFGLIQAVSKLSFTAQNGTITGLLGENGAGKITLLCIISGTLQPDAGTLRIDGPVGALLDHTGLERWRQWRRLRAW